MRAPPWLLSVLWLGALALALGLTTGDAVSRIREVERVSAIRGEMVSPPPVDPATATGYTLGCRVQIVPGTGGDAYHWIVQTQQMLAAHEWRIRHVDYDNAPAGREVHWASLYRWWIGGLAWLHHAVTGAPLGLAVDWAALRSNPLLLAALLLAVVPVAARRFGPLAAALLAIGLASAFPFNVYFAADYPDHHGILGGCGLLTVFCLLAGGGGLIRSSSPAATDATAEERDAARWLSPPGAARGWFAASAVAAGVGLWVSAASTIPVLVGVGLGALWSAWIGRGAPPGGGWRSDPTLWRWWGFVGAVVSIATYLIEYFPSHLGLRLEVNHPLYALAWAGAGELLCRAAQWFESRRLPRTRRDRVALFAAVTAVLLPAVTILLTKERTFVVTDRWVWQFGAQFVAEGESMLLGFSRNGFGWLALAHFLPLLLIVPPLWLLFRGSGAKTGKALAALAAGPALLFLFLTLKEIRWWGMETGLLLVGLAPVFATLTPESRAARLRGWIALGGGLVLLPGVADVIRTTRQPAPTDIRQLVERDLAQWLRQRAGAERVVVAATPGVTTNLIYFGGCTGLGTLYWENTDGIKQAAALFAAATPDEAHKLVRQLGVTHLVLPSWDDLAANLVRFERHLSATQPLPDDTFLAFLLHGGVPPWLRLIPYRLPAGDSLKGQFVLVLEVVPEQTPAVAAARLLNYLLEMDQLGPAAAGVARKLEQRPADLRAQVMLACFQGRSGQNAAYAGTLARVRAALGQASTLEPDERIFLALVLMAGQEPDLARAQLQQTVAGLDERALRRLSPDALGELLRLTKALSLDLPDERLRQLAPALYPPMLKAVRSAPP